LWRIKQDSERWLYEHPTKILKEAADRIAELEYRHENQKDNIAAYQREQVKLMARIAELEKMTETQMDVGVDYVERIAELEGALREIAERGERHLGGAGSVRVARAALRSDTP
jgi:malonyl CoA-acyl carrier protein transacylase